MFGTLLACMLALLTVLATADSQSPYVGQESREIKALSAWRFPTTSRAREWALLRRPN